MEEDTRLVSSFLHIDTVSKGLLRSNILSTYSHLLFKQSVIHSSLEQHQGDFNSSLYLCVMPSVRRKLLSVLDAIDFSQDMPELLQLEFFERTQIEQVISNCEHVNEQGHTVCNVKVSL